MGVAGLHRLLWDGRDDSGNVVESGVYIYQYKVDGQRISGLIYFPLNHAFPHFGLAAGFMYMPAKFKIRFMEPLDMSEYPPEMAEDPAEVHEARADAFAELRQRALACVRCPNLAAARNVVVGDRFAVAVDLLPQLAVRPQRQSVDVLVVEELGERAGGATFPAPVDRTLQAFFAARPKKRPASARKWARSGS